MTEQTSTNGLPAQVALMQLASAGIWFQATYVAAKLGLADLLDDGPKASEELARCTGTDLSSLRLLLRALAAIGVFESQPDGRFALTPVSECLKTGNDTLRAQVLYTGEVFYPTWGSLLQSVRSGRAAAPQVLGTELYDYNARHPELVDLFNDWMNQTARAWFLPAIMACDVSGSGTIADVGGGHGTLLAGLLQRSPGLRGILFDRPEVVAGTGPLLAAAGVADRCTVVGGDFLTAIPRGADVYVLARVLFNWDEERARTILRNCRQALQGRGRLLVIEEVMPDGEGPTLEAFSALNLLNALGGKVLTESEWRERFAATGFTLTRIIPVESSWPVLEAVPA